MHGREAPDGETVVVGRVVRPHGIRGELVVEATGDGGRRFHEGAVLQVGDARLRVTAARPQKHRWLVALDGIGDRDAAEELRGEELAVDADALEELDEGLFYVDDLVGCILATPDGAEIGEVSGVVLGAADLLEVETPEGRVLVPMAQDLLVEADVEKGTIVMELPEGLLEATRVAADGGPRG